MAITTADIHGAADVLAAQGRRPTLAAVRAALGGGSFSTISEALKGWNAPVVQPPQPPAVPQALTDGATRLATALWAQATEQAQQGIADARRNLEQQRTAIEAQRLEAVEAADALAAQLTDARRELEMARKELEMLQTELATTREKLAGATERAQQAESQAVQAKEAEMAARVEAAGLRGRLDGMESLRQFGQGRSKNKEPIQGSLGIASENGI
jgi:multidrug efflux pump subunit AcrA (membrane-fusion protein)